METSLVSIGFNLQIFCSLFMVGVIWLIQLVHYPSFQFIQHDKFFSFNCFHQKMMTYLVAPIMVLELLAGVALLFAQTLSSFTLLNMVSIVFLWGMTFLVSVPLHTKLLNYAYNLAVIKQLIRTNWPRTIIWSLRAIGLIVVMKGSFYYAA